MVQLLGEPMLSDPSPRRLQSRWAAVPRRDLDGVIAVLLDDQLQRWQKVSVSRDEDGHIACLLEDNVANEVNGDGNVDPLFDGIRAVDERSRVYVDDRRLPRPRSMLAPSCGIAGRVAALARDSRVDLDGPKIAGAGSRWAGKGQVPRELIRVDVAVGPRAERVPGTSIAVLPVKEDGDSGGVGQEEDPLQEKARQCALRRTAGNKALIIPQPPPPARPPDSCCSLGTGSLLGPHCRPLAARSSPPGLLPVLERSSSSAGDAITDVRREELSNHGGQRATFGARSGPGKLVDGPGHADGHPRGLTDPLPSRRAPWPQVDAPSVGQVVSALGFSGELRLQLWREHRAPLEHERNLRQADASPCTRAETRIRRSDFDGQSVPLKLSDSLPSLAVH